jgi:hypothetical protein
LHEREEGKVKDPTFGFAKNGAPAKIKRRSRSLEARDDGKIQATTKSKQHQIQNPQV